MRKKTKTQKSSSIRRTQERCDVLTKATQDMFLQGSKLEEQKYMLQRTLQQYTAAQDVYDDMDGRMAEALQKIQIHEKRAGGSLGQLQEEVDKMECSLQGSQENSTVKIGSLVRALEGLLNHARCHFLQMCRTLRPSQPDWSR